MKLIVKDENRARIEEELDKVQRRVKARTVSYEDIKRTSELAESQLSGLTKAEKLGTHVVVDENAQDFPRAYLNKSRNIPDSTHYILIRVPSGWQLFDVFRAETNGAYYRRQMFLTDAGKEAVVRIAEHFGNQYAARYSLRKTKH